ncbi:hypothetical protein M434DRAFT_20050 [Hypoxylon sp. CO27-5]|nr:hypothetical protein M434DRAFT_20050 [Hypoxylon sp. CO27-5]
MSQSQGAPFYMDVPENRYWVVSSPSQIKEIDAAPQSVLSLLGAAKDLLQPKFTMRDFDWMEDKQKIEGLTLIKTLRNDLTRHLPELLPEVRQYMSALFDQHYEDLPLRNGSPGVKVSTIFPLVSRAIAQSNALIFFGKELALKPEFIKAGISMVEDTLIISDVVRLLPTSIADTVGKFLAGRLNSGNTVYDALEPLVAQRFEERNHTKLGNKVPEHRDCIQWIMDNAPHAQPWTVQRVVHELIALWYGSVHITSVTACFAILDVCNHAEYAQPLRDEIRNTGWQAFDRSGGKLFPLMDSFIKESARLKPVELVSIRRKALKPFSFADGTTVQPGQWVCAPLASMNLDPNNHARPDEFHGFRFVHASDLTQSLSKTRPHGFQVPEGQRPSEFIDLSGIPLWGTGKLSCAGRYYASAVIKTTVALFLTKWDMQLEAPNARQHFTWRSWIYPYAGTKAILRPKSQMGEGF